MLKMYEGNDEWLCILDSGRELYLSTLELEELTEYYTNIEDLHSQIKYKYKKLQDENKYLEERIEELEYKLNKSGRLL